MKVRILSRKKVNGKQYRELSCGHEQLEPRGGKSHLFTEAQCKECGPNPAKPSKSRTKADLAPEAGKLLTPSKSPSKTKVAVRCSRPSLHETDFAHCKAKCLTCQQWVCGKCEGSNLRIGNRAIPCDKCWLKGEGLAASARNTTQPVLSVRVAAPIPLSLPENPPAGPAVAC